MHRSRYVVAGSVLCFAFSAQGGVVAVFPAADNTLYQSTTGSLSNGSGSAMFAGTNSQPLIRRGLIRFDLAGTLPTGVTIVSAELRMYNSSANVAGLPVALHRTLESWGEGASVASGSQGSGGPAAPGDATWLHRSYPTDLWSAAGGLYEPVASATTLVGGEGYWTWSDPGLVLDAQSFLDKPSGNFGWIVLGVESTPSTAKRFSTREEPSAALRPVLTVTYIPQPAGLGALLGAGLVGLHRRRPGRAPEACVTSGV